MNVVHRWLSVAVLALAVLFASGSASATGSARLTRGTSDENGGAWRIRLTLDLGKAPTLAHVPLKFIFTKTMVYERALVDGSKDPVLNRISVRNDPPKIESMDVDFSNAMGKIWKGTSFDFSLPRDRGYEAGEYKLQVRTADGTDIGSPMTLVLKGDNPVQDRRSITFDAKKKGIEKVGDGADANKPPKNDENDTKFAMQSQEVEPSGPAPAFIPKEAFEKTDEEKIRDRPKGCGCEVPGVLAEGGGLAAPSTLLLGLSMAFRRRARRRTS
jgi:hypothetical protein